MNYKLPTPICTLLLCLSSLSALSQSNKDSIYVGQFVRNSFTHYGVRNALVTVMDTAGRVIDTVRTMPGRGGQDAQLWNLTVPRRAATFRVRVEHPDYVTGEMTVELKHPARLNSFTFPDMLLKRDFEDKGVDLNEVTVKATRVKLCYKGDTIEVDARAFKLTEGSMLESLVRNVPGCELRDNGDIYMNGRKVDYLMLNGKEFFKGNNRVMLDNLPYYTVDKLQFYNQRSERDQLMGKDVERPDYVMNVRLKQEYNTGYLANVEAGAGTHGRWMGRGFGLRFTDNSRLSLFGNANNVNEARKPGGDGSWGRQNNPVGDTKAINAGGELLVDDKQGRYKEVLDASLLWSDAKGEQRMASQQFLRQGDVFGYSANATTARQITVNTANRLTLKRVGLISDTRFDYFHHDDDALTRSAQFSGRLREGVAQVIDSVFSTSLSGDMLRFMINNVRDAASTDGYKWTASQTFDFHKTLPWGDDLMFTAKGQWSGAGDDGDSHYRLRYTDGDTPEDIRERLTNAFSRSCDLNVKADYVLHFLSGWNLSTTVGHGYRHGRERRDLYRLDWAENFRPGEALPSVSDYLRLRDATNSPHSVSTRREEQLTLRLNKHDYDSRRGRYLFLATALSANYVGEDGTYSRGTATARPSDHRWLLNPSVDMEYQTRGWHETYEFHYNMGMRSPVLGQMADLTDTSNPLAVSKGNPALRPSTTHTFTLLFRSRFGTHGQMATLRSEASFMHNLTAINSVYDRATGAYTFMPVNVNGNRTVDNSLDLRRNLTADSRLSVSGHTFYNYIHSVDMKDNATSTVEQHVAGQNLNLEYRHTRFTLALLGNLSWHGVRQAAVDDINSVDFNYGATLQATLPLKINLSTDLRMYSRRGYADRSMCDDDLLWNAQVDRTFLRGRLLVVVKAFDLLHQLSSTRSTINAQARTETWQLSLPSYVMLTAQYKLNNNPKKK